MVEATKRGRAAEQRLLSLRELAAVYGGSLWYWRSQVWSGRLPVVQVARKQLVDVRDVERFIEQNKRREI